jgi:type I restriction enzyme M protein
MLNGGSGYGEFSKIFDVADFGYREIQIERPLRLAFEATRAALDRLAKEKTFLKLQPADQNAIFNAIDRFIAKRRFTSATAFATALAAAFKTAGVKIGAPMKKVILLALSERDQNADIVSEDDGNPEPDSELRDRELVPLKEKWQEYIAREVTPYTPDAWVDETDTDPQDGLVGRVGYEISFNRYFYKYAQPRPLETIESELKTLESEIAGLLREVTG